jgi:dTMP kinase
VDLASIEGTVPLPDMTVLVTLDEEERQRRLLARGCTTADRETMDERFRHRVLSEMRSTARRPALRPTVEVNLTGANRDEAVERVLRVLLAQP